MNPDFARGGSAAWQERRAKELMSGTLSQEMPLSRLASECGLSVGHFVRAFRQSTGLSPHKWLLFQRVALARELLGNWTGSLIEIALLCGFANQSHFTRVFGRLVGCPIGEHGGTKGHTVLGAASGIGTGIAIEETGAGFVKRWRSLIGD